MLSGRFSKKVSPLKPNLRHSKGIISFVPILPRLTFGPSSLIKNTCCCFLGASHKIFSLGILVKISEKRGKLK